MVATVANIITAMERIAPNSLAEQWDNVGLQIGQKDLPVKTAWVALDPSPRVVAAACKENIDLIITHHPLIFNPLKSIDFNTPIGEIIRMATCNQLAIFTAHTNLDSATDGLNDVLAKKIGLNNLKVLGKSIEAETYKLVVYVPVEHENKILNALFETEAGQIGEYTCCSFRQNGKGSFKPGTRANPFIGKSDEISHVDEIRIETVIHKQDLDKAVQHVRDNHPYETMAYDIYPLITSGSRQGLGRVGKLEKQTTLASFAQHIKQKLELKSIRIAGKPDLPVTRAAVCTGSGSGLIHDFFSSNAQVYVSGDLKYHDARFIEETDRGVIDIGHFGSEYLIVDIIAKRLQKELAEAGFDDVKIEACDLENDPFIIV